MGIDGGGTKTTCAVGDELSLYAVGTGPGSNVVRLGGREARSALHEAIARACTMAEVSPQKVQAVCVGAAGAANPEVAAAIKQMVEEVLPNADVNVIGDMVIALEAALHGQPGVVAIAGTGSIVYGRNAQGATARAGGWGYRVSDEGSGHWIGTTAVTEILRARDAGRTTILLESIAQAWNVASADELVRRANANPSPNFAELFALVQQAAVARDEVALEVLSRAGSELAKLVLIVLHRLWQPGEAVRMGVAGGVFANSPQVRRSFYNALYAAWPGISMCFKITDPVVGALRMARRMEVASR